MASWVSETSPSVKFEVSPAESFMSLPGEAYPSLFATESPTTTTMNALEIMTPRSFNEDGLASIQEEEPSSPTSGTPDKKPVKKRKSWGQVLPEPKTNLPPRKRAKTEDEKEQRRVERVLRNRRAAQSSRERKRQEVEGLEVRNLALQQALEQAQKANQALLSELKRMQQECGVAPRLSTDFSLSQPLFGSQDLAPAFGTSKSALIDDIIRPTAIPATVDPARLSPDLAPVPDAVAERTADRIADKLATTTASSIDMTQHPAEMLYDLQCHQSTELPRSWPAALSKMPPMLALLQQLRLSLMGCSVIISACQRPLTQIALALRSGSSLRPTPSILNTIIWLLTLRPLHSKPSRRSTLTSTSTWTATTASPTTRQRPAANTPSPRARDSTKTLIFSASRIALLQKILTCSPSLARPLTDATLAVLRLVAEGCEDRVQGSSVKSEPERREGTPRSHEWLSGVPLPSKEVLLTLLWTLRLEEQKRKGAERTKEASVVPGPEKTRTPEPTCSYVLRVVASQKKRHLDGDNVEYGGKRRCFG